MFLIRVRRSHVGYVSLNPLFIRGVLIRSTEEAENSNYPHFPSVIVTDGTGVIPSNIYVPMDIAQSVVEQMDQVQEKTTVEIDEIKWMEHTQLQMAFDLAALRRYFRA